MSGYSWHLLRTVCGKKEWIRTMKVYIKHRKRQAGQFQFYMNQFVEAAERQGIEAKNSFLYDFCFGLSHSLSSLRGRIKSACRKYKKKSTSASSQVSGRVIAGGGFFLKWSQRTYPYLGTKHKRKAIIVTSRGDALLMNAFPFFYHYEVIPMLWDVWPSTWEQLYRDLCFMRCRTVLVTVKSMAEKLTRELGIRAYWVPEGIDTNDYQKGDSLSARKIDVYELGRQKADYHRVLESLHQAGRIGAYSRNMYAPDGRLLELAFPTVESLLNALPQIKVIVSFPQIDTHPQKAGGLDTLTQRYWEAMLCRCLIVGRAPQELIDLIGYNPVIDVDWQNPEMQIQNILSNISQCQDLVDKNYQTALKWASWDGRITEIIGMLRQDGYSIVDNK